jgi:hypothetical protein
MLGVADVRESSKGIGVPIANLYLALNMYLSDFFGKKSPELRMCHVASMYVECVPNFGSYVLRTDSIDYRHAG